MTNDPLYLELLEKSWRRKLSPAEEGQLQAWLAAHPENRGDWEADARLNEALQRLADVPVASNFTTRVLQAAEAEPRAGIATVERLQFRWWVAWLPRAAFAAVLASVAVSSYHLGATARQKQLAAGVAAVANVTSLPSPEILKDFDAIKALPPASPQADLKLLAVMQ